MSRRDSYRPQTPRTPALDAALLEARKAAPALQRDRRAPPTNSRAGFSYPSQESIQEAERGLLDHGLMLVDVSQVAVSRDEVRFVWRLTHVPSGEEQRYELAWPTFDDIGEHAHARAACWSHAREKMVCHLLQLRVVEVPSEFVPGWELNHAHQAVKVKVTSNAAPPYTVELLTNLVEERAQKMGLRSNALNDAWHAYLADRHPLADRVAPAPSDYNKLYYWLHDKMAGIT